MVVTTTHDMVRTTLWWSQQQHDMVRTTLWWSQQQHDMVRTTLWWSQQQHEHHYGHDIVRNIMVVTTTT